MQHSIGRFSSLIFIFFLIFVHVLLLSRADPSTPALSFHSCPFRGRRFSHEADGGWWLPAGKKPDSNCISRQQYSKKVLQRIEEGFCCLGDKRKEEDEQDLDSSASVKMSAFFLVTRIQKTMTRLAYSATYMYIDTCILFLFYLTAEHDQNK